MQEKVENFTKIIDRLKYYLDNQQDNFNKLSIKIGVSNSYFSKMYKNKGDLGEDIIKKILLLYENLNPEWLLIGKGEMLKSELNKSATVPELLASQQRTIETLSETIKILSNK